MNYSFISKTLLASILILSIPLSTTIAQDSIQITKKSEIGVDTDMIVDSENYVLPKQIILAPIRLNTPINLSADEWYKGLFYYLASDRYNFKDVAAHYIAGSDGTVYQGIDGGVEKKILLQNEDDSSIVIFYLADSTERNFNILAKPNLRQLVLNLANENSIRAGNVKVKDIDLVIDRADRVVHLATDDTFGSWKLFEDELKEFVSDNYNPREKTYEIEVIELELPANEVEIGKEVVAKVKLKNTSLHTIFSGSDSELLLERANGDDSQFFLNDSWLSKTQVGVMKDGDVIKPEQEFEVEIKMRAPLAIGEISEEFQLKNGFGNNVLEDPIELKLNLTAGDKQIVEIQDTETGSLNVRSQPSFSGEIINKAAPGERYILLDESGSWYQLQLDNGEEGWVSNQYVTVL